jgi:DNA ligase-1
MMAKREFVQLAHPLEQKKHIVAGKYVSEKLDGERAIWDGGVSRGLFADEVPWSNTAKDKKRFYATGLWTRRGKVVHAPNWFLDKLPKAVLDGELFAGRKHFQTLSSVVRNQSGTSDWSGIKYMIFDAPPPETWLADGLINDKPHFVKNLKGCFAWFTARAAMVSQVIPSITFRQRQIYLKMLKLADPCILHPQTLLPDMEKAAMATLDGLLESVLDIGGEGLILKSPNNLWRGERTNDMLKYKPWLDMEAVVVGYTTGRETNDGSRLRGKMGSLLCRIPAGRFGVSGFTDAERELSGVWNDPPAGDINLTATQWAYEHPDSETPTWISSKQFPVGSTVTIKYRELTDAGLPKEGRYWRKFEA